jgi:hypothetical protein
MFPGNETQCIEIPDSEWVFLEVPYLSTGLQTQELYFSTSSLTGLSVQVNQETVASEDCRFANCSISQVTPCTISVGCLQELEAGNISIAVQGTPGDYFSFSYQLAPVVATTLASGIVTNGTGAQQLFSFTATTGNFLLIQVSDPGADIYVKVMYLPPKSPSYRSFLSSYSYLVSSSFLIFFRPMELQLPLALMRPTNSWGCHSLLSLAPILKEAHTPFLLSPVLLRGPSKRPPSQSLPPT